MKIKKILFTGKWEVEVRTEDAALENLTPRQVLIETIYTAISPGTELACLAGKVTESWFTLPAVPGYISVGKIVECGSDVRDFRKGDIVMTGAGHVQKYVLSIDNGGILKVPEGLDLKKAAMAPFGVISITSIRKSNIELGDYVLVNGLGVIGNFAAQLAQLQGGFVIGVDLYEKRVEKAKACGIKALKAGAANIKQQIKDFTKGNGIKTMIDTTGNPRVIMDSLGMMAKHNAEVILLGKAWEEYVGDFRELFNYIFMDDQGAITFKGAHGGVFSLEPHPFVKHSVQHNREIVFDLIQQGKLNADSMITHVISPDYAKAAYMGLRDKKDEYLSVIFDWSI